LGKGNWKSTTLPLSLWTWLEEYRKEKHLASIAQAICFVIDEAGHDPYKYEDKTAREGERA